MVNLSGIPVPLVKVPPLDKEMVKAITMFIEQYIASENDLQLSPDNYMPKLRFSDNEESAAFWEAVQNGTCQAELEALQPFFNTMTKPDSVLEIGPGMGRSTIYFTKALNWYDVEFHLYDGNGEKPKYTMLGPRFTDSFCSNLSVLKKMLDYNGLNNYHLFNAAELGYRMLNLPGSYDLIYSFYSVGYHWDLKYFWDEIYALLKPGGMAFFIIAPGFVPFEGLKKVNYQIVSKHASFNIPVNSELRKVGMVFDVLVINKDE